MAAPSVGCRSCAGQREAAALISQSRRWFYGRVKGLLYDGFFSFCRRPAEQFFYSILNSVSEDLIKIPK